LKNRIIAKWINRINPRTYLIFIIFLLSLNLSAQDIDCGWINESDGKYYVDENENLFTGSCVSYYENGIVSFRASYNNGDLIGLIQWWYDNGQKMKEITYINMDGMSVANGNSFEWFPDGQLMIKETFKYGLPDGQWFGYDSDGKLIKHGVYMNGELISGDEVQVTLSKSNSR
jgi:hypothetical protein